MHAPVHLPESAPINQCKEKLMMECLLSVIMPVYGVEKWLESAICSVLNQTLRNFELILIDDASPDQCGALCDHWAQKDSRIRVIHCAQNGGLSCARNRGLEAARGTYIFFMDSDDVIEEQLLEKCVRALEKTPADWLVFGVTEEHYAPDGTLSLTRRLIPEARFCASQADMASEIIALEQQTLLGYAWNKLYRADFLKANALGFESVELIEDILFNIDCARHARSLIVLDEGGYHYARRTQGSLTGRTLENYFPLNSRRLEALIALYEDWNALDETVLTALSALYARYIFSALERLYDPRRRLSRADRRSWFRTLKTQPLYLRLSPFFHGPMGFLAGSDWLRQPAGWALHVMHTHFGDLFLRLRTRK